MLKDTVQRQQQQLYVLAGCSAVVLSILWRRAPLLVGGGLWFIHQQGYSYAPHSSQSPASVSTWLCMQPLLVQAYKP
jgi:hypothetical protein